MRQSVVPACWFSATMGLTAAVGVGLLPAAESGPGPVWRRPAPMYPAPMRTARDTTAARRPFRARAEFVILPAAPAAIEGSSGRSLPGVTLRDVCAKKFGFRTFCHKVALRWPFRARLAPERLLCGDLRAWG